MRVVVRHKTLYTFSPENYNADNNNKNSSNNMNNNYYYNYNNNSVMTGGKL